MKIMLEKLRDYCNEEELLCKYCVIKGSVCDMIHNELKCNEAEIKNAYNQIFNSDGTYKIVPVPNLHDMSNEMVLDYYYEHALNGNKYNDFYDEILRRIGIANKQKA